MIERQKNLIEGMERTTTTTSSGARETYAAKAATPPPLSSSVPSSRVLLTASCSANPVSSSPISPGPGAAVVDASDVTALSTRLDGSVRELGRMGFPTPGTRWSGHAPTADVRNGGRRA